MQFRGKLEENDLFEGLDLWYMKSSGLWKTLNDYREKGHHGSLARLWFLFTAIGLIPVYFSSVLGPFFIEKNLEGMTVTLLNPLTAVQVVIKFWMFWYGIDKLVYLMDLFKHDSLNSLPEEKQTEGEEIMKAAAKKATWVGNLCMYVNLTVCGIWVVLPILRSEFCRNNLGTGIFGVPKGHNKVLGFWYPGAIDDTPLVQIIYCYETISASLSAAFMAIIEAFSAQLIVMLTARYHVLQCLLIDGGNESSSNMALESCHDSRTLQNIIKEHQKLLKISEELANIFNYPITVLLASSLLILIIGIFNFITGFGNGDIVLMAKFVIYSSYTLVEVTVYSITGSDLELASTEVLFAVYSSGWYKMKPKLRKEHVVMMMRCHRAVTLIAGRMYPVNLAVLTNVLQMAYSTSMFMYRMSNSPAQDE